MRTSRSPRPASPRWASKAAFVSTQRIAWLGLGLIGLPMAARIAAAGWQGRGFDVAAERLALAKARGITAVSSSREAVEEARLVFTSMPTETVLIDVASEVAAGMPADAILVETSTVG